MMKNIIWFLGIFSVLLENCVYNDHVCTYILHRRVEKREENNKNK